MKLSEKRCIPCEGGVLAFNKKQIAKYLPKLSRGWVVVVVPDAAVGSTKKLRKEFKFKNFVQTMGFVNQIALLSQANDHHPDMQVSYSKLIVEFWTHAIGGISENDFVMAAKIDQL